MRPGTDIEDEGLLKPWDQKMSAFTNGFFKDTIETVEENGSLTAVDGVKGGIDKCAAEAESESGTGYVGEEGNSSLATHCCECRNRETEILG